MSELPDWIPYQVRHDIEIAFDLPKKYCPRGIKLINTYSWYSRCISVKRDNQFVFWASYPDNPFAYASLQIRVNRFPARWVDVTYDEGPWRTSFLNWLEDIAKECVAQQILYKKSKQNAQLLQSRKAEQERLKDLEKARRAFNKNG